MDYSLLIDTSKPESYAVLIKGGRILSKRKWKSDGDLSSNLIRAIDEIIQEQNIDLSRIGRFAAQAGPGHFSALRTGIVAATMLAYANRAELVEIKGSNLEEQIKELTFAVPVSNIVLKYE